MDSEGLGLSVLYEMTICPIGKTKLREAKRKKRENSSK